MYTTTGLYLISGSVRGQCTIVSTGNSFITYYLPSTPPGNLRSGNLQIFNAYGSATSTDYQIYLDPVYVSGIAPLSGVTGVGIKISGSGIRDITGLYFVLGNDEYTGVFNTPIFEASTWITTGYIPFISGSLGYHTKIRAMSEGGAHTASQTFFIREEGLTLSGFSDFPTPFQPLNYLRENAGGTSLEWRTQTDVLLDISGVNVYGDVMSGDLTMSGAAINTTGLKLLSTGTSTGHVIFSNRIFSGAYLISEAIVGGITWRAFSLRYP